MYTNTGQEPEMEQLKAIADGINAQVTETACVWHSGGRIWGVLVQHIGLPPYAEGEGWEIFFGFADDVLGWDVMEMPEWEWIGSGVTELTIDQTDAIIKRCHIAINKKEVQFK